MAQSRISKAASIFTRLNGLVKSGLIPWKERPLWYDIYKTFPPDRDPSYRSVLGADEVPPLPRKLFYREDELRAYFYNNLTTNEITVLNSTLSKPYSDVFIQTYIELAKKGISEENLIEASIEEMNNKGYIVKKRGVRRLDTSEVESEEQIQENLSDAISRTLEFLNKKQNDHTNSDLIETKPDEHDKTMAASIQSSRNVSQQETNQKIDDHKK